MMTVKKTYEEAYKFARERAQRSGYDYCIIEKDGHFIAATERSINLHYPQAPRYNVRYMH